MDLNVFDRIPFELFMDLMKFQSRDQLDKFRYVSSGWNNFVIGKLDDHFR